MTQTTTDLDPRSIQRSEPRDYHSVIAKVAASKEVDIDKLERLMRLQEEWERRQAALHYNEAMAAAQAEMEPVSKDSVNPITRSRYASLPALMEAISPIYTRHGFSVEFNEETAGDRQDGVLLVAYVSNGAETRRRSKWIPVSTTGIGGKAAMTSTHASIAAVTYGRRALLKMVFNIAEEDDDGNAAGGSKPFIPPEFVEAFHNEAKMAAGRGQSDLRKLFVGSSPAGQSLLRQWEKDLVELYPGGAADESNGDESIKKFE